MNYLAGNRLCVRGLCKPLAAKGEHAVWGSGWCVGSWVPGVGHARCGVQVCLGGGVSELVLSGG